LLGVWRALYFSLKTEPAEVLLEKPINGADGLFHGHLTEAKAIVITDQICFSSHAWDLLFTIKASSAALPSIASPCGVLLHTPQSSLLGA
jgi:hypothetical protein